MQPFIEEKREQIAELCRTHHVRRFSVFGSAVRDDFDPLRSDVDVRVIFEEDIQGYVRNFHDLHDALTQMFGRKVDIISSRVIRNPYFARAMEEDQVTLYAA